MALSKAIIFTSCGTCYKNRCLPSLVEPVHSHRVSGFYLVRGAKLEAQELLFCRMVDLCSQTCNIGMQKLNTRGSFQAHCQPPS